jgi:actin-like ATPase involved in cell morphogenesis
VIADFDVTEEMLRYFIRNVLPEFRSSFDVIGAKIRL